ncbi:MAG: LysM peptidoglycan-binding domain-containing protein [Treponema sp.]|nr:LysM peptidoglycan-binding domain-containing protein [Treponema sp.]
MKKFTIGFMVLLAGMMLAACAGAPPVTETPPPPPPPVPEPVAVVLEIDLAGSRQYTVVSGDVLSGIARRFYGSAGALQHAGRQNGFFYPTIILATPEITDQDLIFPGMVLTIPELRRNLENPGAVQAIKGALLEAADVNQRRNRPLDAEGLRRLANSL